MEIIISDDESHHSDLSAAENDFFPEHTQLMIYLKHDTNVLVVGNSTNSDPLLYNINQILYVKA